MFAAGPKMIRQMSILSGLVNFFGSLHLVVGRTIATMISKYAYDDKKLFEQVEVITMSTTFAARLNRACSTRFTRPAVAPYLGRGDRGAQGGGHHDVRSVPVAAPFGQPHQPVDADDGRRLPTSSGSPAYFTDDEYYAKLDKEFTRLANTRDEGVRRIAARTVGLSPEAQQDLVHKVDELRRREHLDV